MTSDSDHASSGICFVDHPSSHFPASYSATAGADADVEALKRLSENLRSIFQSEDFAFCADATITCNSRDLPVHRCVLSARSPFFRDFFFKNRENSGAIEARDLLPDFEVEYDALVLVMEYIYSGRVGQLPKGVCICADETCSHAGCWPAVQFMVEVLYSSFTFHIFELVNLFQRRLIDILERVATDDVPLILLVSNMCSSSCQRLQERCIEIVVKSDLDMATLEKKLPHNIVKQIMDRRICLGLLNPLADNFPNKYARQIHRAIDSDDVELVSMLLKEGHTTLDDAYALHYAVEHCDSKITMELLNLVLADVNHRNLRGYTVLHVAAIRKDPKIIVSLLTNGAFPFHLTPDGRKAVDIAKRMTKSADYNLVTEQGNASPKDKLCIEVLEQAERRDPLIGEASVSLAMAGDDMRSKLLYLENRVGLARLMFPREARLAMDIAQVDGTLEFKLMDLNENPCQMKEEHRARMKALARTVELGKKFFPRCSNVLDKIMDEDLSGLVDNWDKSEEKKRRFNDVQDMVKEAFYQDTQERDRSAQSSSSTSFHHARR